jgi:DNA-binding FadR family transcriptional regulator
MADELGISVSKLREQLEVARALGLVEVRPKTGVRTLGFSYEPALRLMAELAIAENPDHFEALRDMRTHLETSYWTEAVSCLEEADIRRLEDLVEQGWARLRGSPIQIPHAEHRALHMTVFARLPNPLAVALLETYWYAYEAVGLGLYADYAYLSEVWTFHERMVHAIRAGDFEAGKQAFIEHTGLLRMRGAPAGVGVGQTHPAVHPGNWRGDLG